MHRDERYGEKLATPDTSIADLIGEVDPIKVAEGRYLSDELTLHYGLVPRTNRGIFAINELPDLAERIQVGLLNVLEERDVQIRGYKIRLPLDVLLVASANPDDYTNRGRIITPLKDRFGSQIRTHYPLEIETEVAIMRQEARSAVASATCTSRCPTYMEEIVAEFSHLARQSSHVNQRSGVSVRLSVSQPRGAGGQRRAPGAALGRARGRAPHLRPRGAGRVDVRQDRDREPRGGPRGPDRRQHAQGRGAHRVQAAAARPIGCARSSPPSTRASWPTSARTSPRPPRPGCWASVPGAARAGRVAHRGRRVAGRGGQRDRVRARGPAPVEAPQQGRRPAAGPPSGAAADARSAQASEHNGAGVEGASDECAIGERRSQPSHRRLPLALRSPRSNSRGAREQAQALEAGEPS